jgi:hypothetical protein
MSFSLTPRVSTIPAPCLQHMSTCKTQCLPSSFRQMVSLIIAFGRYVVCLKHIGHRSDTKSKPESRTLSIEIQRVCTELESSRQILMIKSKADSVIGLCQLSGAQAYMPLPMRPSSAHVSSKPEAISSPSLQPVNPRIPDTTSQGPHQKRSGRPETGLANFFHLIDSSNTRAPN